MNHLQHQQKGALAIPEISNLIVQDAGSLAAAIKADIAEIAISGEVTGLASIALRPGQALIGATPDAALRFRAGVDGIRLSADNRVVGLTIETDAVHSAIVNDVDAAETLGCIELSRLRLTGSVRLLADGRVRAGHVEAHDIDIVFADATGWNERPSGYGVEVVRGVFTLWNRHSDPAAVITADLTGLAVGRPGRPARGSGVFVGGVGPTSGRVILPRLETGTIHVDGGIAAGTHDRIAGGVFLLSGGVVDVVTVCGPVNTYGQNDMVLDNWGIVDLWQVNAKVTSFGPSGVGFVNFGTIGRLDVRAPIETFGEGARGFNVYDGVVRVAEFDRVVTHADGAVGIQISQPIGALLVRRGIETRGGMGQSLVKGVLTPLPATALSIRPGGRVGRIEISGGLRARAGITPLELDGTVGRLVIDEVVTEPVIDP